MRVRAPPARQDQYSCRSMERISAPEAGDGGSNPPWGTTFVLSSNRLGRHPFTVKTYGFEPRRHDKTLWSFGRRGVCDGLKIHRTWFNSARLRNMVVVAQLARAPDCGSGGRGFEPLHSPKREYSSVAERMAVNHRVVGSSPSIPARWKYGREV